MSGPVETPAGQTLKGAFDQHDPPEVDKYLDCVHCGMCLPTCPTYLELGNEMDSPRGRIYLIRAASEGRIGINATFVKHMDLCLVCRACETACPSGVQFGHLMEAARGQIERRYKYPLAERLLRALILTVFPNARRMALLMAPLRWYQKTGLQKLVRASGVLRLFGRFGAMEALLPPVPDPKLRHALPEILPAKGARRARVGLLTGCVQSILFPHVNLATAHVLAENGFEVVVPEDQGCCGSLLIHEGERERGKILARRTIEAFERAGVEVIVVNAAGCGSVMKEYEELLKTDPVYAERARAFSRKVKDISEVLADLPLDGRLKPLPLKVTYHEPCHLAHGQRVRLEPRILLKAIPGLQLIELEESDLCCGSAGVYNLLHPELSKRLLERKLDRIVETGAEVLVSGNPGCLLQIEMGLKKRGLNLRTVHPVELLDWSYKGAVPPR